MLDCLEHTPGDGVDAAVIWLHGLGADGYDFAPLVPHLQLPRTRFVFPHAPIRPVTINGGQRMRAWYDIRSIERGPEREPAADVREAGGWVEALIRRELARGVPAQRVVLGGFSQGAAMTLFAGLRFDQPLAGLAVLSGYLVLADALAAEAHLANASTPLLAMHGTRDEVVPQALGRAAFERLAQGRESTWRDYPMGHEVCGEQVVALRGWLAARLA